MLKLSLCSREIIAIQSLLKELTSQYSSVEDARFLLQVTVYAQELPRDVRLLLNEFRMLEPPQGICLISGYPIDSVAIGPTPPSWDRRTSSLPTLAEDMLSILYGSLLGDNIGWITQQAGLLVHDVLPVKGHEHLQINSASGQTIWWHTEDAFHPYRPDYVGLTCLRNPSHTATTVASIDGVNLREEQIRMLFEPRFIIRPDLAHGNEGEDKFNAASGATAELVQIAYKRIQQMHDDPQKVAVLFGDPRSPYIRLDPYFMDPPSNDEEAYSALTALCRAIDENIYEIALEPGDTCFIDNYKAVHGRKPFTAKFDGTDRWLKRILVTRDLRKSRNARPSPESRIIF